MPLAFSTLTSLLQRLENIETHDPPLLPASEVERLNYETQAWFRSQQRAIISFSVQEGVALLSSLLPERRTDRVYGIQAQSLCRILCRTLGLSASRARELQAYRGPGRGDLGTCLARVLDAGGPPARPAVDLQEVDDVLEMLAAECRFSDPKIKARRSFTAPAPTSSSEARDRLLGDAFKRMSPDEGKWFVRLILKDFAPVRVHEARVLKCFHFLLPDLLRFQQDFDVAVRMLKENALVRQFPDHPDPRSECLFRRQATSALKPVVGVRVGRPEFDKARGIEHALRLMGTRRWVLERKYDGEYCQIHVDLRLSKRPSECIRIFSKSGKDSTDDKKALQQTLVNCLLLGTPECKIQRQAILLGELVVFSDSAKAVAPFDEIRKHVTRSGSLIGTDMDSQPKPDDHMAIVFFDLLLLDDKTILNKPIDERRAWLREVYRKIPGRAWSTEWKIVDFADSLRAEKILLEQFAASIAQRCEGLILKPCDMPYFDLESTTSNSRPLRCIKVKKDYIAGMGDEADFAVIGASYNVQQALKCSVAKVKWTEFHVGCLTNAADVRRFDARPTFKMVGSIQQEACIPKAILQALNLYGSLTAQPYSPANAFKAPFNLQQTAARPDVLFSKPMIVEVLGSGFEKPSDCDFYMLRHARMTKLHQDRLWDDCVSFEDLQQQAAEARAVPPDSQSVRDQTRSWLGKLERKLKRRLEREGTVSPSSRRASPRKSRDAALDGTTLVQQSRPSAKRSSPVDDDTPYQVAKCRRSATSGSVLSDIKNHALGGRKAASPRAIHTPPPAPVPCTIQGTQQSPDRASPPGNCASTCPLFNSTVYLAPCIAGTPYITENLLSCHAEAVTRVSRLAHWERDSFAFPKCSATVSESQAYEGVRKIVLVEKRRAQATQTLTAQLCRLNDGRWREVIEVWDWRLLEEDSVKKHLAGLPGALERHFIGKTTVVGDSSEVRREMTKVRFSTGQGQILDSHVSAIPC